MSVLILMQFGAIAQMGERLHGMQEVVGSNPIGSILPGFLYFFILGNKIDSIQLRQNPFIFGGVLA